MIDPPSATLRDIINCYLLLQYYSTGLCTVVHIQPGQSLFIHHL